MSAPPATFFNLHIPDSNARACSPSACLYNTQALGLWFCGKSRKGYPPHTARQYLDAVHGPSNTAGQLRAYLAGRAALQVRRGRDMWPARDA